MCCCTHKNLLLTLTFLVLAFDVASQATLFWTEFQDSSSTVPFATPTECLSNYFACFTNWKQYSLDTATILFLRLILSVITAFFAIRLGTAATDSKANITIPSSIQSSSGTGNLQAPLLGVTIHSTETKEQPVSRDGTVLFRDVLGIEGRKNASKVAKQKILLDVKAKREFRKNCLLALAFFINTAVSMFVGIKVVVFDFSSRFIVLQAIMLGSFPVWINLEFVLLRSLVEEFTKLKGTLFKGMYVNKKCVRMFYYVNFY